MSPLLLPRLSSMPIVHDKRNPKTSSQFAWKQKRKTHFSMMSHNKNDDNNNVVVSSASTTSPATTNICNVVVAGAGPAGLLTVAHLLRRNEMMRATSSSNRRIPMVEYRVTLLDTNRDFGVLSMEEMKKYRSWIM
jgi:NADPH-dependent 2,4-dienoyl-CoA reductase/sulfur reductase-like enzyme